MPLIWPRRCRWRVRRMAEVGRHLRISGLVQGVGFRWSMVEVARRAGLAGWVRNCADGSVEACLGGEPSAVAVVLAWAVGGAPRACVDQILIEECAPITGAFRQLPDASAPSA